MSRALGRRQSRVQSRVRTLEIFKREAAQIGVEGGEVPAVGEDPEARGLERLSEGDLLEVPTEAIAGDLDTTATVDGSTLIVTVASLSAVGWAPTHLSLTLDGWKGGGSGSSSKGKVVSLVAQGFAEDSLFDMKETAVEVEASGHVELTIPPFSVVQLTLAK